MISSLTALFIIFAAVIGSSAMVAILAYFLHRIRQLESTASSETGPQALADEVGGMREELHAVQEQLSIQSERLDFTEKLLMSADDEGSDS